VAESRKDEDWDRYGTLQVVRKRLEELMETNPMMGHRCCRLSLTYPEILEMQVRAILQAAVESAQEGFDPHPEIMVPLVACEEEMRALALMIHATAEEVFSSAPQRVPYSIGTMIELPRAAVMCRPYFQAR
jgi:pyruvate,orthophosphate dikinase